MSCGSTNYNYTWASPAATTKPHDTPIQSSVLRMSLNTLTTYRTLTSYSNKLATAPHLTSNIVTSPKKKIHHHISHSSLYRDPA